MIWRPTARLLTDVFGYEEAGHESANGIERLRLQGARRRADLAAVVDLMRSDAPSIGRQGAGTIHHVAFRAEDDDRPAGLARGGWLAARACSPPR
jgi:glyoxalase family protein